MAVLKTYDFSQVAVIVGGVQMHGFIRGGDAVTIENDADDTSEYVGNDGEESRSFTNNKLKRAKLKFMQTSESNPYLSGLRKTKALVPIMIKDGSGFSLFSCEQGYVKVPPAPSYGDEVVEREWTLVMPSCVDFEGGN